MVFVVVRGGGVCGALAAAVAVVVAGQVQVLVIVLVAAAVSTLLLPLIPLCRLLLPSYYP